MIVTDTAAPRAAHTATTTAARRDYRVSHAWACTCGAQGTGPHGVYAHAWGGQVREQDAHAEVISRVTRW